MRISLTGAILLLALAGCSRREPPPWQGYLEGEFVYVACPLPGALEALSVEKGSSVEKGRPLFALERASEIHAVEEAKSRVQSAEARAADLRKGSRPSELAALEARLAETAAASTQSERDLERAKNLFDSQALPESDYDRARLAHERDQRQVDALKAQIETARTGARTDAIAGADADAAAARAALSRAEWAVAQKSPAAPDSGLVYDTLYREGEFVPAGNPVVVLLPPSHLKVRFFVSEAPFASLKPGGRVTVSLSGHSPVGARISYLSPQPEYTPPVLYNRDNRSKLVFMAEAVFEGPAPELHPGQPADVRPAP